MDYLITSNWLLMGVALLVLAGIASSLFANRFGAPLLLVFLVLGMLLGEEGPGGIAFEDLRATYTVGSLALAIILFDGGLRTRIAHFRGALAPAILLSTVGVLITGALTAGLAMLLFDFSFTQGLVLGTVVASTDAAAVFFLLRANGLHLTRRVAATLEIESGSNDPFAVFLTVLLVSYLLSGEGLSASEVALHLGAEIGIGLALGALGGLGIAQALNRFKLPSGLHPLLAQAGAIAVFAGTNLAHGSGFLAVYLAGLVVGNRPVRAFANVLAVQDAATWLAQLAMFLLLGLLVSPSALLAMLPPALAIAAFLMLVARPVAVIACLAPFGFERREMAFMSWVGLRGAVGIFLASIPLLAGLPYAETFFNVAFIVVLASLLIQGWTLGFAAHKLDVALPRRDPTIRRVELDLPGQLEYEMVGYEVAEGSRILHGSPLPGWARPVLVVREGAVEPVDDKAVLRSRDFAYYLAPPGDVYRLDWLFAEPDEALAAEREVFGEFALPGNVPLSALADFYGLTMPREAGNATADALFRDRFDGAPHIGDRLRVGAVTLVVRELVEERVTRIGLKFASVGSRVFGDAGLATRMPRLPALLRWPFRRSSKTSRPPKASATRLEPTLSTSSAEPVDGVEVPLDEPDPSADATQAPHTEDLFTARRDD